MARFTLRKALPVVSLQIQVSCLCQVAYFEHLADMPAIAMVRTRLKRAMAFGSSTFTSSNLTAYSPSFCLTMALQRHENRALTQISMVSCQARFLLMIDFMTQTSLPWQCLNFLPDPQGQGSLRAGLPQVPGSLSTKPSRAGPAGVVASGLAMALSSWRWVACCWA